VDATTNETCVEEEMVTEFARTNGPSELGLGMRHLRLWGAVSPKTATLPVTEPATWKKLIAKVYEGLDAKVYDGLELEPSFLQLAESAGWPGVPMARLVPSLGVECGPCPLALRLARAFAFCRLSRARGSEPRACESCEGAT
jgi:hypothetical protein